MGYLKNEKSSYNQTSLYDRVKKLLVSFEWSDCSFSVCGKGFKAHKLILGISSPVFEAMLYGPLSTEHDVTITDIQPDIFQLLLNYIYTDTVEISCIEQAFELLYASRKYLLEHLTETCISYIQANISVDNVIEVLNYPEYMHDKQLIAYSLKLFCEHANYLLQEKNNIITYICMKAVLESDQMNITEKDLIKYVFEWSVHLCHQSNLPATFENRRKVLNDRGLFKLLRFPILSTDELEDVIIDVNNLLLPCESDDLKKLIKRSCNIDQKDLIAPVVPIVMPRNSLKLQRHVCYRSPIRSVAPIIIDSNNYIIHSRIKVNKSVFITSLCVPTRMAPAVYIRNNVTKVYSEQLSVSVKCECDNSIVMHSNFMNTVEYDSVVDIELNEPCFIKKDKWYKISFVWPQNRFPSYSYVVEFRDKLLLYSGYKIMFEFDDSSLNAGNGGSFLAGLKFCL